MIIGIIQARASSRRLPGKVLKPLLGRPMLARQLERLQRAETIDRLVVATSTEKSDDPVEALCTDLEIDCFRGDLEDVLDRVYHAANLYSDDHVRDQILRLTADCPITDPELIDELVGFHLKGKFDYSSNCLEPTFPDGLDAEIMTFSALEEAWSEATEPSHLEHVTPFIYSQPERYRLGSFKQKDDFSKLRWTVDEPADFAFVRKVFSMLYPTNPDFGTSDLLDLLVLRPELTRLNAHLERNEGYEEPSGEAV